MLYKNMALVLMTVGAEEAVRDISVNVIQKN